MSNQLYFINQRYNQANNSTQGLVTEKTEDGYHFFAHIIEDDNMGGLGDKRIGPGLYKLQIHPTETPKTLIFRKTSMPYLERFIEVVDYRTPKTFDLVFFHVGNDQADTEGCQTLNDTMGNNSIQTAKEGSGSTAATKRFYDKVYPFLKAGGSVLYEIRDEQSIWK